MKQSVRLVQQAHLCKTCIFLLALAFVNTPLQAAEPVNLTGDWVIQSSVGGVTPIMVNCSLIHKGDMLSGTCTPVMENPQPSELDGKVTGSTAHWGYDVVFNGNAGRVDFNADSLSAEQITGTLNLSGNEAPFIAERAASE